MDIFRLFLELSDKTKVSEYLEVLLRYLFNSPGEYSKEEIREQVTNILEGGGDVMQTIAQKLREEGIKIGEEKGIKIGEKIGKEDNAKETAIRMLKKGFDINTIVEITGLEPSVIEKLRKPGNVKYVLHRGIQASQSNIALLFCCLFMCYQYNS